MKELQVQHYSSTAISSTCGGESSDLLRISMPSYGTETPMPSPKPQKQRLPASATSSSRWLPLSLTSKTGLATGRSRKRSATSLQHLTGHPSELSQSLGEQLQSSVRQEGCATTRVAQGTRSRTTRFNLPTPTSFQEVNSLSRSSTTRKAYNETLEQCEQVAQPVVGYDLLPVAIEPIAAGAHDGGGRRDCMNTPTCLRGHVAKPVRHGH